MRTLQTSIVAAFAAITATAAAQVPTQPAPMPATEPVPEGGIEQPAPEPPPEPEPDESMLGGPGESCRARADCKSGLKCIGAVCTDELEGTTCQSSSECGSLRCIQNVCTSGVAPTGTGPGGAAGGPGGGQQDEGSSAASEWMSFEFGEGTHGFAGISMMGGPAEIYAYGGFASGQTAGGEGSFAFELYGGVMFDRFELAAHFSPVATKHYDLFPDTNLTLRVTAGGYIPITDMVSWVMRGGVGFVAVDVPLPNDDILPQIQADLIGVAVHVGHLNIEVGAPSFRMAFAPDAEIMIMNWMFGAKVGYVF